MCVKLILFVLTEDGLEGKILLLFAKKTQENGRRWKEW